MKGNLMPLFDLSTQNKKERDAKLIRKAKNIKSRSHQTFDVFLASQNKELLSTYKLISDIEELQEFIKNSKKQDYIALTSLNDGDNPLINNCLGFLCSNNIQHIFIPLNLCLKNKEIFKTLCNFKLIGYKVSHDIRVLRYNLGIEVDFYWDVYLAAKLLNENENSFNLLNLCNKYKINPYSELSSKLELIDLTNTKFLKYFADRSKLIFLLYLFQIKYLKSNREDMQKLYSVFTDIEMPCTKVIANIEDRGIVFDTEKYESFYKKYNEKYKTAIGTSKPKIEKILNTYLKPYPKYVINGKIHSFFDQYAATTGRMSSSNPNLQALPSKGEAKEIRQMLKAKDNYILISADFSAQEPRLTAHLCQDKNLIEIYQNDKDLYAEIASKIFKLKYDDCLEFYPNGDLNESGKQKRSTAKIVFLGILYGSTAQGIAKQLGISEKEAQNLINNIYIKFPKLKEFVDNSIKMAQTNGYVTTIWGRKRRLPALKGTNKDEITKALRQCTNARVQGSGADMSKIAMLKIENDSKLKQLGFELLLPIHDEFIGQCPLENKNKCAERLQYIMNHCVENIITVPIKSDIRCYLNWEGE